VPGAGRLASGITGHTRFPLGGFADFGYVMRFLHLVSPEIGCWLWCVRLILMPGFKLIFPAQAG